MPAPTTVATPTDTRHASDQRGGTSASNPRTAREHNAPDPGGAALPQASASDSRGEGAAGAHAPALGNPQKVRPSQVSRDDQRRRDAAYSARRYCWQLSSLSRVRACGRDAVDEDVSVKLTWDGDGNRTAGFGGVETCGNGAACPVCSRKIASKRVQELAQLIRWNAERGGTVALATFTLQHTKGTTLRAERQAHRRAWRHMTNSRRWKEARAELGCDGYVRGVDCTHTEDNGWHLHQHVLLIFDGPISPEMARGFEDDLFAIWAKGLAKSGFTASREHGADVKVGKQALEQMGRYVAKLAFETGGARWKKKRGAKSGRTPWEILDDVIASTGNLRRLGSKRAITSANAADLGLWNEWEEAMQGMHMVEWSKGLKDRVGVNDETDEQIAADDGGGEILAYLPSATWRAIRHEAEDLLAVAETDGPDAALAWLRARRLPYHTPTTRWTTSDTDALFRAA